MRTVAIIQARMDSQRLPGKALMKIGDRTILEWVIHRTRMVEGVDAVTVATSRLTSDLPIIREAMRLGVEGWAGSPDDVLARFKGYADKLEATHILRVTADCPLLCPELNSQILSGLKGSECGYASMPTGGSNGLVQEAFTVEALRVANENATTDYEREHVVPWMLENLNTHWVAAPFDLGRDRWCVDTQDDLDSLRMLYELEPGLFDLPARDLVGLAASVP